MKTKSLNFDNGTKLAILLAAMVLVLLAIAAVAPGAK